MLFVVLSCQEQLILVQLDTPVLASRAPQLHALALKHGHIASLLDYLAHTMHSITEAWENILLEMDSKLASYAARVPEGSVSADFLDLLMFGIPSDELEMFLLQDLTEKGLKKLGHSIELSYSNIQKLVLKHLHSVGQSLAYHLAELRGMARWKDRYESLGLKEDTVTNSLRAAGSFLVKATEVQQVIDSSMKNYKVFFRWLYVVILRLTDERVPAEITKISQQDLAFIAEFLHNFDGMSTKQASCKPRFNLERLGQYLVDQDLSIPPDTDDEWEKLLQQNVQLAEHASIIPHHKSMSLVQEHSHLRSAVHDVFSQPQTAVAQQFMVSSVIKWLNVPEPRLAHVNIIEEKTLLLALLEGMGFYLMQLPMSRGDALPKCVYFHFTPAEDPMKVLDVQFYLPDVLSVLLEQCSENRGAVFVQFPMQVALQSAKNVPAEGDFLKSAPRVEATALLEPGVLRPVENMVASKFAVSGSRKVAVVLSESRRKVRLFEMEVEEEEEDDDVMDGTATTLRDSDASMVDVSKNSDEDWTKSEKLTAENVV